MKYAKANGYILPAFNTTNLEMTYAIVMGLAKAGLPGYVQISSSNLRLSSPYVIAAITREALKDKDIPVALHLDHGKSYEDVKACIDAGFTSIMIDASHLPFEENIAEVRRVVDYCHFYNIPVEAELGALSGKEDEHFNEAESKTDPSMVASYVSRTGCDLLAVSVGNVHGLCLEPKIDLPLLRQISELCTVPLVMHGGSGIPTDVICAARQYNLIKINYGADLRRAFVHTFGKAYEMDNNIHDVIQASVQSVENVSNRAYELVTMINQ